MNKRLSLSEISEKYKELHSGSDNYLRFKRKYIICLSSWVAKAQRTHFVAFLQEPMRVNHLVFDFPEVGHRSYAAPRCIVEEVLSDADIVISRDGGGLLLQGSSMPMLELFVEVPDDVQTRLLKVLYATERELKQRGVTYE